MIRHVVMFTWDDKMTDEMEKQLVTELTGLAPKLAGLRSYHCGPDVGLIQGNFDFAVVADFDDADAYLAYRSNAEHQEIISRLSGPHAKSRASVQYEI
jgi:hypothetical protein